MGTRGCSYTVVFFLDSIFLRSVALRRARVGISSTFLVTVVFFYSRLFVSVYLIVPGSGKVLRAPFFLSAIYLACNFSHLS